MFPALALKLLTFYSFMKGYQKKHTRLKEYSMEEFTLGMGRVAVEIYDATFDAFKQQEEAFTHAALRAVTNYIESWNDEQKNEITDLLIDQQNTLDEDSPDELFERKILVDDPTRVWLERIATQNGEELPESVLTTGVFLLSVMLEIVKRKPNASLYTFPTITPIKQILDGKPQLYN